MGGGKQQSGDAAGLGGQLQAAQRRGRSPLHLAQHRRRGTASQTFLHGPQDVRAVAAANDDQAGRVQVQGGQPGAVKAAPLPAPQHGPPVASVSAQPRQQGGAETQGGGALTSAATAGTSAAAAGVTVNDLVQGGTGQAAPGQGGIHLRRA